MESDSSREREPALSVLPKLSPVRGVTERRMRSITREHGTQLLSPVAQLFRPGPAGRTQSIFISCRAHEANRSFLFLKPG